MRPPETLPSSDALLTTLMDTSPPTWPPDAHVMTARIDLPPGDGGPPPHRHSGPVFGYVLEGALRFELEGEPERVFHPGDALWEPGGDVIHYQSANALPDRWTRFVIVMVCTPDTPMLTLVDKSELATRANRRAPRSSPAT